MELIFATFTASLVALFYSAKFGVKKLVFLANSLRKKDYIIGLLFLGLATSLPELIVGVNSALQDRPQISLVNIIGSNIINLTFIIGITAIISGYIYTKGEVFTREGLSAVFSIFLPILFLFQDYTITRLEALFLILFFFMYYFMILSKKEVEKIIEIEEREIEKISKKKIAYSMFSLFFALIIIFISADLLIKSGSFILTTIGLPEFLLGLFVITFGTALPELTIDIISSLRKRPGFAIGNLYGTIVTNSCLVIGIVALINPIKFDHQIFISGVLLYLVGAVTLFLIFAKSKDLLSRWEGFILVSFYILFIISSLLISTTLN